MDSIVTNLPKTVRIVEVGPRDGLQNQPRILSTDKKLEFIRLLAEAGLKDIEVSSFVHPKWIPQLADADELIPRLPTFPGMRYSVLVPNLKGLERALKTGVSHIAVFTAASETFNKKNINMTIAESLDAIVANASGCGTMLKTYDHLLRHDPALREGAGIVSGLSCDISELLLKGSTRRGLNDICLIDDATC